MKKMTKLMCAVTVLTMVVLSFAGCSLVKDMDDIDAYRNQQQAIKEAEAQMSETVMTLNGDIEISGGYYGWFFSSEYNNQYSQAAAILEADSSADSSAVPEVNIDLVKENVNAAIAESKLAYMKAVEAGIELTSEDKAIIKQQLASIKSQVAQQGIGFSDYLLLLNTNETYLNQIVEEQYMGNLYFASLMGESFATAKHILVQFGDSVRTKDEAIAMAKDIKAELDGGADFDKVMEEKSQDARNADGSLVNKNGNTFSILSGQSEVFTDAAMALDVGEISDVIVDDDTNGCYIIKRSPLNLSTVAATLMTMSTDSVEGVLISAEKDALAEGAEFKETDKINYYTEIYTQQ